MIVSAQDSHILLSVCCRVELEQTVRNLQAEMEGLQRQIEAMQRIGTTEVWLVFNSISLTQGSVEKSS